jgi:hypothetical protein
MRRLLTSLFGAWLALCSFALFAQQLSPARLQTLKTHILSQPDLTSLYNEGNLTGLADALNADASPAFIVWKSIVPNAEVGAAFVASGLSAMTSANNDRLVSFALWNPLGVLPSRADHRQFFNDVFSPASGASTRTALLALWKRSASRFERVFATGTGSDADPATLGVEGPISYTRLIGL